MVKLSMFSACQSPDCRCIGWKSTEEDRSKHLESTYCPKFTELCRNQGCIHPLESHVSHLSEISEEQLNQLLGAVVDVENLFMSIHREDDADTRKVYYYLFRVRVPE